MNRDWLVALVAALGFLVLLLFIAVIGLLRAIGGA